MLPLFSCLIRDLDLRCVASEVMNRTHTLIAVPQNRLEFKPEPSR